MKIIKEEIKVKGAEPLVYEVKFTHRGPLMEPELIYGAGVLFGGTMPEAKYKHFYSHMWGGMFPGESLIEIILDISSGMGVKDLMLKYSDSQFHKLKVTKIIKELVLDVIGTTLGNLIK